MLHLLALLWLWTGALPTALAQPSTTPLGPSVLDTGSAVYATHAFELPAPGPGAAYHIGVLAPRRAPPPEGFPALYVLDGQAALEVLDEAFLASLDPERLPVIVTVGYATDRRFAVEERTRDYTPPDPGGAEVRDPLGRAGGGAEAFFARLRDEILPRAEALAPVDPSARTLWGHSYGGLFVLWTAGRPDSPFARHVAASPSLWWDHGGFLARVEAALRAGSWPVRRLDLHVGTAEHTEPMPTGERFAALVAMRRALPPTALDDLDRTARAAGLPGVYERLEGLRHGEVFGASLRRLLP